MYKIPLQRAGARGRGSTRSPHQHLSCSLCHRPSPVPPSPAGCFGLRIHQMLLPSLHKTEGELLVYSTDSLQASLVDPLDSVAPTETGVLPKTGSKMPHANAYVYTNNLSVSFYKSSVSSLHPGS